MLRVGLTGGIGSGKSSVAARLVARGARLVDSDRLAREVVAPGTPGLTAVVAAFGDVVLDADGALDRPALAAIVFDDPDARARLNAIVHPLVRRRSAEMVAAAPADAVVVQDVPLLVEGGMGAQFPLVVVVHADADVRVRRLVEHRGMTGADARARIAAQASDAQRRAAADVWLDNSATPEALTAAVDALWADRITPFAAHLRAGRAAPWPVPPVPADPEWPEQARRLAARVAAAARAAAPAAAVVPVGPTAVPGLAAPDVLDLQLGVPTTGAARHPALSTALREVGFLPVDRAAAGAGDGWVAAEPPGWASADPARPARLHLQVLDSPEWRRTRLVRDWLRADADARTIYREYADGHRQAPDRPSFARAVAAAGRWAASSGWMVSLDGSDTDTGKNPIG